MHVVFLFLFSPYLCLTHPWFVSKCCVKFVISLFWLITVGHYPFPLKFLCVFLTVFDHTMSHFCCKWITSHEKCWLHTRNPFNHIPLSLPYLNLTSILPLFPHFHLSPFSTPFFLTTAFCTPLCCDYMLLLVLLCGSLALTGRSLSLNSVDDALHQSVQAWQENPGGDHGNHGSPQPRWGYKVFLWQRAILTSNQMQLKYTEI